MLSITGNCDHFFRFAGKCNNESNSCCKCKYFWYTIYCWLLLIQSSDWQQIEFAPGDMLLFSAQFLARFPPTVSFPQPHLNEPPICLASLATCSIVRVSKNTAQTGKVKFKDHKTPKRSKGFSNSPSQCHKNRAFKCVLGFITACQFFTYSLSVSVGFHFIILNWPADIKQL